MPRPGPDSTPVLGSADRLEAIQASRVLEGALSDGDRYARIALAAIGAPVVLFSVVDDERQHFVVQKGLAEPWASAEGTPLSHSYCRYVVENDDIFVVEDSQVDERVRNHPANDDLGVRAYAGVPVHGIDQSVLGSFCLIDHEPREWTADELALLRDIATSIESELALRDTSFRLADRLEIERAERAYDRALAGVSEATSRAAGWNATSAALVGRGAAVAGASFIVLAAVEEGKLVFHHGPQVADSVAERWRQVPLDTDIPMANCLRVGAPIVFPDRASIEGSPALAAEAEALGMAAFAAVPVGHPDGPVRAAIGLGWSKPLPSGRLPPGVERLVDLTERALGQASRFERAAEQAQLLEQLVIPRQLPDVPGLDLSAAFLAPSSLQRVGGDVYDAVACGDGAIGIVVADATGHDLEATRTAARLRHTVGSLTAENYEPAAVLCATNRYLRQAFSTQLVTCVYLRIDRDRRHVTIANAGHLQPRLITAGGVRAVGPFGEPLLGLGDFEYSQVTVPLSPGDALVGFTDGLVERRGVSIEQGEAWLDGLLANAFDQPAQDVLDHIVGAVAPIQRDDDVALIVASVSERTADDRGATYQRRVIAEDVVLSDVREWVAGLLLDRDRSDLVDAAELIATELVTNAREASEADDEIGLRVRFDGPTLEIVVDNPGSPRYPLDGMPSADSVRGRGLPIVRSLATDFEFAVDNGRVTVTARLVP